MVSSAAITAADTVLEIGPGKGALTAEILATGAKVIAIEKDDRLIPVLKELFSGEIASKKLTLVHGDALDFDPKTYKLAPGGYKIVANIPYYITGLLLRHFLESSIQPESITVLLQKEVALRIVARDGKESILSLSVKVFGTPKYCGTVSKRYFSPAPKVDSAILHIEGIGERARTPTASALDIDAFFTLVKAGFAHKRKTVLHNLSDHYPKQKLISLFEEMHLSEKIRAEDIPLATWITLTHKL